MEVQTPCERELSSTPHVHTGAWLSIMASLTTTFRSNFSTQYCNKGDRHFLVFVHRYCAIVREFYLPWVLFGPHTENKL